MKKIYRNYLLRVKEYVNLTACCRVLGINQSNLSNFILGDDSRMSEEKLELLIKFIQNNFVA